MVEETNAGSHLGASFAVEVEARLYVRLAGLSFGFADSCHRFSFNFYGRHSSRWRAKVAPEPEVSGAAPGSGSAGFGRV